MKNQFARRTLSLLLAVVMVAGMLPVGALASTVTEPEQLTTQTTLPVESAPETVESAPVSSETETAPVESAPAPSETETVPEESTLAEEETSLPTEPQEDAPAPLALEGDHPDYLSVYDLYWDESEEGFREGKTGDDEIYRTEMVAYDLNVNSRWSVIFYLNTWDETAGAYTKTPVIPQAGSNLVINTCQHDNSGIAASAENGDYFVNISSTGTIDAAESYVTYGGLSLPVTITALQYGFFSSSTASWETYLPEQFDLDGNEFYWIYRDEATVSNVQIRCNDNFSDIAKFFSEGALDNVVTLTQVSNKVYKLTVNENLVNWGKYAPYLLFHVSLSADTTYYVDEISYPGNAYNYLSIDSKKNAKEYALIDVNGRGYRFYDDGVVFCNYETDETVTDKETGETWNICEDAPVVSDCFVNSTNAAIQLPEGFHYDYASNTLTLKDVTLDDLYIGYEVTVRDEDGNESILPMLPDANLTLVLEGSNTIKKQLHVLENSNVTLAGTGTLTLNGAGFISTGTTLDMETNSQTILLGSGGYLENYGTLKGETQYVEGYTDLRIAWLKNDGDGWYLPEGASIQSTSMCGLMAECEDYVIFYLYTWDGSKWNAQPVIPTADESWTITKLTDGIQSGATDSSAYVKVCSQGSIDGKETYLTYNGVQYSLYQGMLDVGFYTAPEATLETVLHGQAEYTLSADGENVLYLVARDPYDNYTVSSIDWDIQGSDENYTVFYAVEPAGEEVWKITFQDACLNQTGLALTAVVNCGEYTQDMHLDLINPNGVTEDKNPVVARFLLEENGGIGHQYRYYADGTSQVYARNVTQWDKTDAPIAAGFAYDVKTNTLTLTNASLHKLDLTADALLPGKRLTISLVGDNTINYLTVSDSKDVTIQGSGTLTIGANVVMTNRGVLAVAESAKLCLPSPDAMQWDDSAIFTGTLSYTEGTSYIAYRALSQENGGAACFKDKTYYGMGGAGIMGMQERLLVFYRAQYTDGKWVYTPVKPAIYSGYSRISLADYQGAVDDTVTEAEKAAAVVMTAKDLGGGEAAQLTIDEEQFDWTLYDLHAAYYSSTTPSPYTYLGGETQHYFETTKDGNNTFYFIVRETDTGITVQDDVTWFIDTWDEDYTAFIPGLTSKEDLVTIEEVTVSGNGNRVWKITVSKAFVDYVNHAYNWKNFQLVPHVTWEYTGNPGETETSDYWAMTINPPQETMQPALRLSLCKDDHTDLEGYQFYADGKVYHDGKEATLPTGMTWDGANLTLENANLDGICLGGFEESYQLNLVLKGENTINSLHIHDNHAVDVTGEGTLAVTGGLRVFDQTILSFPDHALILGADCDTEIWGQVNGEFGYASGYSEIVLYALWHEEEQGPTFHGPFTLKEYTSMAMNTSSVLFLKKKTNGEDWIWQPVKPTSKDDRLTIADYTTDYQGTYSYRNGYDGAYLEEHPVWAEAATMFTVDITPNFLGDERVKLTFGDETCEWYVSPLAYGFFSQPEATLDNYFKGDAQYFFDTDPNGDNTFYFITLNALCGYTVESVTWDTDTRGQDYSCFGDELVTVTEVKSDSSGNRVWKITASDSYVNLASRYGMYKNFSLNMYAEWGYPDGSHGGVGGYGMFINPPKEQLMPAAAFRIDDYDYYYYEDVQGQILKMGQDEDGNPDVSWVTELPQGVAYDVQSNTMTLTDAQLETLMFWYDASWTDEDGVLHTDILLPNETLTLNLVGKSTLAATDRNVFFAYGGCHVVITGEGTLNLETTNTFLNEESFSTLWLANGSTLTIGGSATVNLTNKTSADDVSSRMYGINSDGTGSLTVRDSATLNLPQAFVTNYTSFNGDLSDSSGLKALTLQDNATLNSGSMEFYGCAVTQTGGTWNVSTNLVGENEPCHIGLYLEETTLNLSGGALNILPRYEEEDYPFKGIQLAAAQLNMTGGEIKMHSPYTAGGYGIVSYWNDQGVDGSMTVTGGTIDITTVPITDDEVTFAAINVGTLTMEGGTINASGELHVENLTVKDGTINQTSTRAEGFWVINGSISGGELNLTDAGLGVSNWRDDLYTSARFDISGGKVTITGTDAVAEEYEYAGLTNYGYLSMNDGELIVNMPGDVAVKNFGTFHQMGGKVTLAGGDEDTEFSGGDAALRSSGTVLLNSGTMDITGPVGVYQTNEENLDWKGELEERFFQVGGGDGDHQLTIHATNIGICADGVVELTGGCQVNIQVTGENGCGILAESYKRFDEQQTKLLIHAAANLNVNATGMGIFALCAPVSIYSDTMDDGTVVAPTVTLRGATAVAEQRTEETSNFTFGENMGLYSAAGAGLNQWGTIDDETYYLLDEVGDAATWVEISRADDTKGLFAQFANIDGKQYRIYEKGGVQTVYTLVTDVTEDSRWVEGTLPKGVSYDLTTNTLTLAKNTSLASLYVDYAKKNMGQVTILLPSRDLTIQLSSKATIAQLMLGSGLNTTLQGGTLTLTDNSSVMSTLTVAKGAGLTINAGFAVYTRTDSDYVVGSVGKLIVEKGAKLTNNNVIDLQCDPAVYVDVQGTFAQGKNGITTVGWNQRENITGNLTQKYQTLTCYIDTEAELTEILTLPDLAQYRSANILASNITLENDHDIPKHVSLGPGFDDQCNGTLTIKETATLTVAGLIAMCYRTERVTDEDGNYVETEIYSQIQNDGALILAKGGEMYLNGNFSGNAPINNGGKIYPQASKVTATASTTAFDLYDWETQASDEEYAPLTLSVNVETKAAEEPLNRVTWTSSNKKVIDPADIRDNGDGTYTVTEFQGTGKVTLTATTIDGAKKTAKVTVNVTYLGSDKLTATTTDSVFEGLLQVEELVTMEVYSRETMVNWLYTSYYTNLVEEVEEDETNELPLAITFKSSNPKVAEVDVYGNITGKKAGTAKITATMNIPGDKRSVSITVKVVAPQILRVNLYDGYYYDEDDEKGYFRTLYHEDNGNTIFDLADLNEDAELRTLKIFAGQLTWNDEVDMEELEYNPDEYIPASKLKWACSDTSVATVKTHKDGYAIVTIKKGAHGMFTITATATDTNKTVGSATFIVKDYTPRLSNPSITLNPKLEGGVKLELVESYENAINSVTFYPASEKNEGKLEVVFEEGIGYTVRAILDEDGKLANQTIKGELNLETDMGTYTLPLTVAVKNAEPKITVSQFDYLLGGGTASAKFDLAYRGENSLGFTSSSGEVYRVELNDGSSPDFQFHARYAYETEDGENQSDETYKEGKDYTGYSFWVTLAENPNKTINTKLKFLVYVKGYHDPVAVTYTLKTTTSKIKLTVNPTSSVINTALSDQYKVSFRIFDGNGENILDSYDDFDTFRVLAGKDELSEETYRVADGKLTVTFAEPFSGTLTIKMKRFNWTREQQVTHRVTKTDKAPAVTLDSTLTLYRTFQDVSDSAVVNFNQSNLTVAKMDDFKSSNSSAQNSICLKFNDKTGKIVASFYEDVTPVKAGTYTFTATAYYKDGDDAIALSKKVSVSVKVVQEPTFKMESSTIKLNKYLAADVGGTEQGWAATKGNLYGTMTIGDAGYLEITGLVSADGKIKIGQTKDGYFDSYKDENGILLGMNVVKYGFELTASLLKSTAKKTIYTLYPVVERPDEDSMYYYTMNTPIKVTVQPHSSKASVSLSTSGKLDTLLPDSAITYTATVKNALHDASADPTSSWNISNIELLDEKGYASDLFQIEHGVTDKKGVLYDTITLKLDPEQKYDAKTYKVKLQYTICGIKIPSGTLSIKLNQSAAKITASTVNYYQAEESVTKSIQLNLTSPVGAGIGRVELNEKKTSKELLTALALPESEMGPEDETEPGVFSSGDVYFDEEDPSHAVLDIKFWNPGALKAGKSYSLYLDVYPYTLATTQKPTTVKVTVKVAK